MKKSFGLSVVVLILVAALSACSSGGGGGGGASYSVGGTVSGLTGTVVLQNNGGDDLTIAANGAFTFATKVADGGAYAVTVLTQPETQTCTASSNTGTIAGANVTDVSVVCSTDTYSVGGTVSGLTGSGLVLQNNGGDDLAVPANSASFTFATEVADGAGYSVTVKTQPSGQTCTASSNTGTISGANVTNVSVVCSVNSYTVGGTVSGLTGTGLVLRNNGADDLSIVSNGTFTFATKVAYGAGYAVTVKTHPLGQGCSVSNGNGTMGGSNVTNVSISCSALNFGAKYSAAQNWNDYVKASDTATACDGTETGGYTACIHGGEKKSVQVTGKTSCTGLTASDSLGAFDWSCDASTNPVQMVSTGLKDGKNLSDLLDFTTVAWKTNSVTVSYNGSTYLHTSSTAWWTNDIVVDNDGMTSGQMDVAGTIYLVTTNATGTYSMGAGRIGFVIKPGVVLQGTATIDENIVYADTVNFLWIEGSVDSAGDNVGVYLNGVKFSALRNLSVENANPTFSSIGSGVYIYSASNNMLTNVAASNNKENGVELASSSNNTLAGVTASNNGYAGVELNTSSNYNTLTGVTAANNSSYGVNLSSSSNNTLSGVTAANNGSAGVYLGTSSNNTLSRVTAANNYDGVELAASKNNTFTGITAANNYEGVNLSSSSNNNTFSEVTASNNGFGVYLGSSSNNTFTGITASNNDRGVYLGYSSNNTFSGVTASNNGSYGVYLSSSSNNYFTGLFKVGNNGADCYVNLGTNPGLDDDADPSDVETDATHSGLCVQEGAAYGGLSDFGTAVTGVTLASSFVGKTYTDSINLSDTGGPLGYPVDADAFDWLNFENAFRGWGRDGIFGEAGSQEQWSSGNGAIWDWSLTTTDTVIKDVVSLPTGTNTLTHVWYTAAPPANQAACDSAVPGSVFNTDHCENTFLKNAIESAGDGTGNDNFLCESNETCLFTPNIGSYQGHGNQVSAGTFTNGTVTGVMLMMYETNGR